MSEQYDPQGRYDVINRLNGDKLGELVKGVLYEGAPDYRQKVGTVTWDEGLSFTHEGAVFDLVPQAQG